MNRLGEILTTLIILTLVTSGVSGSTQYYHEDPADDYRVWTYESYLERYPELNISQDTLNIINQYTPSADLKSVRSFYRDDGKVVIEVEVYGDPLPPEAVLDLFYTYGVIYNVGGQVLYRLPNGTNVSVRVDYGSNPSRRGNLDLYAMVYTTLFPTLESNTSVSLEILDGKYVFTVDIPSDLTPLETTEIEGRAIIFFGARIAYDWKERLATLDFREDKLIFQIGPTVDGDVDDNVEPVEDEPVEDSPEEPVQGDRDRVEDDIDVDGDGDEGFPLLATVLIVAGVAVVVYILLKNRLLGVGG